MTHPPEFYDIIRKRLGQVLSVGASIFAQGVCNQMLIITETVEKLMRAATYLLPDAQDGTKYSADITGEVSSLFSAVSSSFYGDPRLNHNRYNPSQRSARLRPNDFVFFPMLAAAISTGNKDYVKADGTRAAADNFSKNLKNINRLSATENLLEDFTRSAFDYPGKDMNSLIAANAALINSAKEKMKTMDKAALEEIKTELKQDFLVKSKDSADHLYKAVLALDPPEKVKIISILSGVLNDIGSVR